MVKLSNDYEERLKAIKETSVDAKLDRILNILTGVIKLTEPVDATLQHDMKTEYISPATVMPAMTVDFFKQRQSALHKFVEECMVEGVENDYGQIPGVSKKCLFLPGAEKLERFFGLRTESECIKEVNDPFGKEFGGVPYFQYDFITRVYLGDLLIHIGVGTSNSQEGKWGYKWIEYDPKDWKDIDVSKLQIRDSSKVEYLFAVQEKKTDGKYGKPMSYWQEFQTAIDNGTARIVNRKDKNGTERQAIEIGSKQVRVPNEEVASQANTMKKISKKRSYVDGIKTATGTSDLFTVDVEDFEGHPQFNPSNPLQPIVTANGKEEPKKEVTITENKPIQVETSKKEETPPTPAAAVQAPQQAASLPAIDQPRELRATSYATGQKAPSAAPKAAPPAARKGAIPDLFGAGNQQEKPKETITEKRQEVETKVPSPVIPVPTDDPDKKIIEPGSVKLLIRYCEEQKVSREVVKKFLLETFNKKANELTLTEFAKTRDFIFYGLITKPQIEKLQRLAVAAKIPWEACEQAVQEKFGKTVRHMDMSECIWFNTWLEDNEKKA